MNPNQLALYILLVIICMGIGFLFWVLKHFHQDGKKKRERW
jgi:hypothetical protein